MLDMAAEYQASVSVLMYQAINFQDVSVSAQRMYHTHATHTRAASLTPAPMSNLNQSRTTDFRAPIHTILQTGQLTWRHGPMGNQTPPSQSSFSHKFHTSMHIEGLPQAAP